MVKHKTIVSIKETSSKMSSKWLKNGRPFLSKYLSNNLWKKDLRLPMAVSVMVNQFCSKFVVKTLPTTVANADIANLSTHSLT